MSMISKILRALFLTVAFSVLFFARLSAQSDDDIKLGIAAVEPFRIAGNIYYVGSSDLTSYLIVTPKGNILIDSGIKEMVPQVTANIAKLGYNLADTKIILNSHAHFDHAGGIAELRRLTKARFLASELDAALLKRGGKDDPNFGDRFLFESTVPDGLLTDRETVKLGGTTLTANITSGHTKGCTTWTTTVREGNRDLNVIFVCSVSSPGYKLVGNEKYADIVTDYQKSFEWWASAKVDIFLASHAGFFNLEGKSNRLKKGSPTNPFIDREGYRDFIEENRKAFVEKLAKQKTEIK